MVNVSVIVPVYNAEKYLRECMDSLLHQTLADMEFICVDDGSVDTSLEILKEYQKNDDRIQVVHKENSGYGDTINCGILAAQGEYIGIVEPDDYIALDMYELLWNAAKKFDLDMVKGDGAEFIDYGSERNFGTIRILKDLEMYNKILCPQENDILFTGVILNCSGIFRRSFIQENKIMHNATPGAAHQDIGFWFQTMLLAKKVMLLDRIVYYYRKDNAASSSNNAKSFFYCHDEYKFIGKFMSRVEADNPTGWEYYTYRMFSSYRSAYNEMPMEQKEKFIYIAQEDFLALNGKGKIRPRMLSNYQKRLLNNVMENPESILSDSYEIANRIKDRTSFYEKMVVYGIGDTARKYYNNMYSRDRGKIVGFVTMYVGAENRMIYGRHLSPIENFLEEKDDIAILVSISPENQEEVLESLNELGFQHVVVLNSVKPNRKETTVVGQLEKTWIFPFTRVMAKSNIILYGAGEVGQEYCRQLDATKYANVVLWVDRNFDKIGKRQGREIASPNVIKDVCYDFVVVAIERSIIYLEMRDMLLNMGVEKDRIVWSDFD